MDINDILNSLNLDLSNPEVKRGAMEAISAILDSRVAPSDMSGVLDSSKEVDIELDPDLIQPSQKHQQPDIDTGDVEINDEDEILKQIRRNDSDDDFEDISTNSEEGDSVEKDASSAEDETENTESNPNTDEAEAETDEQPKEGSEDSENTTSEDEIEYENESSDDENDAEHTAIDTEDEDTEDTSGETTNGANSEESEETDEINDDSDEDDLLDNELNDIFDDKEVSAKYNARKIKRERTLAAAKKSLADAQAKKAAPALIKELEKAIEALESLVEAAQKSLKDISDNEFNMMINRVFDAIGAVGDNSLTFSSDEERELKAQEIKTDLQSREIRQELSDEDIAAIRAETQAVKAREKEVALYKKPARSSFKGFKEFLNSLYRAIALQVQTNEVNDDTWSAINRRYSGTGVLKQGQRKNDLPNKKIPVIDFYFDQSGSWSESDIAVGKKAVAQLADMEENGQIKVNIYYFANDVFTDADSARAQGGTRAWNEIIKNIIATQATNIVIMTDADMEDWWKPSDQPPMHYTVPGYVWYLWRDGENAPRLPRDLKGRGGVQQFAFSRSDV